MQAQTVPVDLSCAVCRRCRASWVLVLLWACAPAPAQSPDSGPAAPVDYAVIVTGAELLTGVYADGHTYFLTKTLRPLGLHCVSSVSVDDQEGDIRAALDFALSRCSLVIVTGGLGPTATDITRDVLSKYTGISLHEQPDVLRGFEQRLNTPRERMRANLRRQSRVPDQGTYLRNPLGTAVGLVFEFQDKVIVALPGPPRELQPMVGQHLIPYLARKFGVHTLGCSITVRFVGLGQSQIDQVMKDTIRLPEEVMQSSQFEAGRVDFTFALPGDAPEDRQRLQQLRQDLQRQLGQHIYAYDAETSLEQAAVGVFHTRGQSVALAEIGSQGMLAAGFCQSPAGRQTLAGAFVASDPEKMKRLLDIPDDAWQTSEEDRLQLIAGAAARHAHSDWAVVVGAHEVGDQDEGPLRVLVRSPQGKCTQASWPWRDAPRAATQLFDFLRQLKVEQ